jgi:hypothetical protein
MPCRIHGRLVRSQPIVTGAFPKAELGRYKRPPPTDEWRSSRSRKLTQTEVRQLIATGTFERTELRRLQLE